MNRGAHEVATAVGGDPARLAVVAHRRKSFGAGLPAFRKRLENSPYSREMSWTEVDKSAMVTRRVQRALSAGATRVLVWGGDGTVQRAVDALAATAPEKVSLAVMPAGTANLFANNMGIPIDFDGALAAALGHHSRVIDVGQVNGERFGVMTGTGLDALMIRDASGHLKDRFGRLGYVWTVSKNLHSASNHVKVRVDGDDWFEGRASCVLVGNVGNLIGGLTVFEHADPADGLLDVGVIRAESLAQWARLVGKAAVTNPEHSSLFTTTRGRKITITLDRKEAYELDGGDRSKIKKLKVRVRPQAISVCVPSPSIAGVEQQ
jgi:YegS/Rv2252/BmrU family lipid kinase